MSERSGMSMAAFPLPQVPDPDAFVDTRLTMQTLVAGLFVFGMGSGDPKRQRSLPGYSGLLTLAALQLRLLPVSAFVVATKSHVPSLALKFATLVIEPAISGSPAGNGLPTAAPTAERP